MSTNRAAAIQYNPATKNPSAKTYARRAEAQGVRLPSSSHSNPGNATKISGVRSIGGNAAASNTPSKKPTPYRRHPDRLAKSCASRHSGASIREPGRARSAESSGIRDAFADAVGGQSAHPQPLDATGISLQHLELNAVGVGGHLAAFRHAAREAEYEPAQGGNVVLVAFGTQPGATPFLEGFDRHAAIGTDSAVRALDENRMVG